jgi:HAD superfamily hydrolase (TIGR01450 family)
MTLDSIRTVVCDVDGVIVLGSQAIAGAGEALESMREAGLRVLFVTNNSTKTRADVADRLAAVAGYVTGLDTIINSGWATGSLIAGQHRAVYVLGAPGLRATLRETGVDLTEDWQAADAVVVGLDFDLTYRKLADTALAVQNGAAFYATNTDSSLPTPEGLHPGAGSVVALIERVTGVTAVPCGKPFAPMRRLVADFVAGNAVMVGDRADTDVAFGKAEGWATALVLSGVTRAVEEVPRELRPDFVMKSIAELPARLGI